MLTFKCIAHIIKFIDFLHKNKINKHINLPI